ncbi:PQQ-binding-like beta-propeller repeat protein [Lewinella sp. W8]|uniref:outer membrane protein assembly factor BamB family protein n=1 Tax=Lewinella sp. W8 TaxID=2528208 RepID=UPI0010682D92|nr:PQQ-binding-like beta-propeller repeat protein [Lewinella sp. W8]MTB51213.1 hypothetical protein [Lewinella sp. W8]
MRVTLLTLLFMVCGFSVATAQVVEPLAETDVDANGKSIFVHTTTGIPVLQTMKEYIGLSPKDGTILWSVERNSGAALTEATSEDGATRDFDEIPNTPLVFASGTLLNVVNGKVIFDGGDRDLRILRTYYVIPERDLMLLEIGGKGAIYLYGINPFESRKEWDVQLREASGLSQAGSEGGADFSDRDLQPQLNSAGDLVYPNGKYLALVDLKSGSLKWNEKINAGYLFTNKGGSRMVVAEKRGGLGGLMDVSGTGGGPRKFGKKLHLIDTETGQSVWKKEKKLDGNVLYVTPYDDGFLVVHDEGMNIFSYTDTKGDGRWKKGYKEKGVVNVEFEDEGLMVYFKNKRMLVDPVSGEDKWKKAEKLEKEPKGFLWGMVAEAPEPERIGMHDVTFYNGYFEVGKGFRSDRHNFEWIIPEEDRIAFATTVPTEGTRIGKPQFIISVLELGGEKPVLKRKMFGLKKGMAAFDKVENGYFLYNDRGYVLMDYDADKGFSERKDEWYPDPTAALRTLTGIATAAGGAAYAGAQSYNMLESVATTGDIQGAAQRWGDRMDAMSSAGDVGMGYATDRQVNGRVDDDFAFFFARDGKEGLTLFKVDKNTGEEVNKFRFDDKTPLYEVDYRSNRLYYAANGKFKIYKLQ